MPETVTEDSDARNAQQRGGSAASLGWAMYVGVLRCGNLILQRHLAIRGAETGVSDTENAVYQARKAYVTL